MSEPEQRNWKAPVLDERGDVDEPDLHAGLLLAFAASADDTQLTVHFSDAFGQFHEMRLRGVRGWLADSCTSMNYVHSVAVQRGPQASESDILRALARAPEARRTVEDVRNGVAHLVLVRPLVGGTLHAIAETIEFASVGS